MKKNNVSDETLRKCVKKRRNNQEKTKIENEKPEGVSEVENEASFSSNKLDFNESDKSVTKILLLELKKIKKILVESSKDVQKVFKFPLSHLKINVIYFYK